MVLVASTAGEEKPIVLDELKFFLLSLSIFNCDNICAISILLVSLGFRELIG